MAVLFDTKVKTLENLSKVIQSAKILPIMRFTVDDFKYSSIITSKIKAYFKSDLLVVRSSSLREDSLQQSNAGHYESVLNVPREDDFKLSEAIRKVIASFDDSNSRNEIFVQPQLEQIDISGVALTCDVDTLAPYYTISYEKGTSDIVTSGKRGETHTLIHYKFSPFPPTDVRMERIIEALEEIQSIFEYPFVDVEFAMNKGGELFIFQVRPLVTEGKENLSGIRIGYLLAGVHEKLINFNAPRPGLLGDNAVFGVMPDWNPAEIIGKKPKRLALTLYKELITDSIWAYQRDNYGYRNLRSHPLLISFVGVPYIDVRASFNSFIPKNLSTDIARKLAYYYISKLQKNPQLHDKIEFSIVHSCYHLNIKNEIKELLNEGFSNNEIKEIEKSLRGLTNDVISNDNALYKDDLLKIDTLKLKYELVMDSNLSIYDKIYWLIEDCKRYGTLPFAGVARAAFIAVQFLKSFLEVGIMNDKEYCDFLNSLSTVSKNLDEDLSKIFYGSLSLREFKFKYGHLRPGTYDIESPRYDQNFKEYFPGIFEREKTQPKPPLFKFSEKQIVEINKKLSENGISIGATDLITFFKEAIEGREYAKFIFTRSLSQVLEMISELGDKHEICRDECAFLDISTILNLYANVDCKDIKSRLKEDININKILFQNTKAINLPNLIVNPNDIYSHYYGDDEPNFITLNYIKADVITEDKITKTDLEGKIVCIKSADPGFDFLFTKKIGGLITQYGGANSHMAIRCAELGTPAVVGAGEKKYNLWVAAKRLEIDGASKIVRLVSC